MTIKEIVGLLKDVKEVKIAWNGNVQSIDIFDPIVMDAFGDYLTDGIFAAGEDKFEISLAVKPLKKEA